MKPADRPDRVTAQAVTASKRYQDDLARLAAELGRDPAGIEREAFACLAELQTGHGAFFHRLAVRVGRALTGLGYTRIDCDPVELGRVRDLLDRHAVVVLSSHRSYLDGGVLTVAFHDHGLPRLFEFVGINMAFWPLGLAWRRMGGILLRRRASDPVYKFALREFLRHLVGQRMPLRWFIEGTRSRTGKLAPPKLGLLSYVVDGYRSGDGEDLMLLPVSVSYDQLQEVEEFAGEAQGARKEVESAGWLVRYLRAQRGRFGTIYLRFGEPVSLRGALGPPAADTGREQRDRELHKLAFEVCWHINQATPITGIALVGIALLAARGRQLSMPQIRMAVRGYLDFARSRGLPRVPDADTDDAAALERNLQALAERGVVSRGDGATGPVFGIAAGGHLKMAYYRNSLVHFFVVGGIAELALLAAIEAPVAARETELLVAAHELRRLLEFDFFFEDRERFERSLVAELATLDAEWRTRLDEGLIGAETVLERAGTLSSDMMLRPFIEAYGLVADTLLDADPSVAIEEAGFIEACEARGQRYLAERRLRHPESVSRILFRSGLMLARHRGVWDAGPDTLKRRTDFANCLWAVARRMDVVHGIAARRVQRMVESTGD